MTLIESMPDTLVGTGAMPPAVLLPPSARYGAFFDAMCKHQVRPDGIDIAEADTSLSDEQINLAWKTFEANHPDGYTSDEVRALAEELFTFPVREPRVHERRDETVAEYCARVFNGSLRLANLHTTSQIGLDRPVLEPGGRFGFPQAGYGRLYNWDMWPTLRGAVAGFGQWGLDRTADTLDNFSQLASRLGGNLPNANTTWGIGRTQQLVAHRIVRLRAVHEGDEVLAEYLPLLEKHFAFWREGADDPNKLGQEPGSAYRRVVRLPNGKVGYRYWDDGDGPRDEMYLQDLKTLDELEESLCRPATEAEKTLLFKSLRAGAESGEDFTLAQCRDHENLYTIRTIELMPVKLNAMQFEYAQLLADTYLRHAQQTEDAATRSSAQNKANYYQQIADDLREAIHTYCLSRDGFCADYDFVRNQTEPGNALSGIFALSAGVFSQAEGKRMLEVVDQRFLRPGGLINTLYASDLQWDANAWPIMQMEAIDAAVRYGRCDLALKWCTRWLAANDLMFARYGALYEKSDPNKPGHPGGQGEYECVEGLLMTLGVDLALRNMLPRLQAMAATEAPELLVPRPSANAHESFWL